MIWEKAEDRLSRKKLFLFDIDGTLALGEELLEEIGRASCRERVSFAG